MARPQKAGLDYFPMDCNFFQDERIMAVGTEYGALGELAVTKLLCLLYSKGYFLEVNKLICLKLVREVPGLTSDTLMQILDFLAEYDFFDADLWCESRVLTSVDIQNIYFEAAKRRKFSAELPFLLVEVKNYGKNRSSINCSNNVGNNSAKEELMSTKTTQSKVKESKVKESKVKEKKGKEIKSTPDVVEEKKVKEEFKKEVANTPSSSSSPEKNLNFNFLEISDQVAILQSDDYRDWRESVAAKHEIPADEIAGLLRRFENHCKAEGKTRHQGGLADTMSHFSRSVGFLRQQRGEKSTLTPNQGIPSLQKGGRGGAEEVDADVAMLRARLAQLDREQEERDRRYAQREATSCKPADKIRRWGYDPEKVTMAMAMNPEWRKNNPPFLSENN